MISFSCVCGRKLAIRDDLAGQVGRCPICGTVLTIPNARLPNRAWQPEMQSPIKPPPIRFKLEHSLCAPCLDRRTGRVFLDPIIKRGADIPCSFNKTYYPDEDPAERMVITFYEGDVYDNPESPENVKLAEIPWEFKPPRPRRDAQLEVTFEYGEEGILTVQIHDVYANLKRRFAIQQVG